MGGVATLFKVLPLAAYNGNRLSMFHICLFDIAEIGISLVLVG